MSPQDEEPSQEQSGYTTPVKSEEAPLDSNTTITSSDNGLRQRDNRLSTISKKYDIDGDGKLDSVELKMREMDLEGQGHLSNEKVYKLMRDQMETNQRLFNMRRVVIVLCVLVVILAVSNLGTAWAAAILAKDTDVSSDGYLRVKGTDDVVSTTQRPQVFAVKGEPQRRLERTEEHTGRKLVTYEYDGAFRKIDVHNMAIAARHGQIVNLQFPENCPTTPATTITYQIWDGTSANFELQSDGLHTSANGVMTHLGKTVNRANGAEWWMYSVKKSSSITPKYMVEFDCHGVDKWLDPCGMKTNVEMGPAVCYQLYEDVDKDDPPIQT